MQLDKIVLILGIPIDASDQEAKSAYRKLAMQWHPDRNSELNAQSKFTEIGEAFKEWSEITPAMRISQINKFKTRTFSIHEYQGSTKDRPTQAAYVQNIDLAIHEFLTPLHTTIDFDYWALCGHCHAVGCLRCHQRGYLKDQTSLHITIPIGTTDGAILNFRHESRDIQITITMRAHQYFTVAGYHLKGSIQLNALAAMTGTTLSVPTLEHVTQVHVPAGSPSDYQVVCIGAGLPDTNGNRGNLIYTLKLITSAVHDPQVVEYLKQLQQHIEQKAEVPDASWWRRLASSDSATH